MTPEPQSPDALDAHDAGSRIARGGASRIAAYGMGTVFSLVGVVFVTRALGPARFADFQTVLNLITVVAAVTDVGLTTLGVREFSQRAGAARVRFLRTLLGLRLVLTFIGAAAAVAIVAARGAQSDLIVGTALMGGALALTVLQSTWTIPLFRDLRLFTIAGLDTARQGLLALAYVGLALVGAGTLGFLAAALPVQLVVVAITLLAVGAGSRVVPSADLAAWRNLISASLGFALAMAVGTTYQYIAQLMSTFVIDAQAAGLFSVAFRTYIVLCAVPGLIVSGAFPVLARRASSDAERFDGAIRILTEATILLGVALGVGVVIGAPFIIDVVGGDAYRGAIPAMRLLGVALILASVITTWGSSLFAAHRHAPITIVNVVALVTVVAGVAWAGPRWDATGTALAVLVAESVLALGYGIALLRSRTAARPRTGPVLFTVAIGLMVTVAGLLVPVPPLPASVVAVSVFALAVAACRLVPDEVVDLLPERLRGPVRRR